MLLEEGLAKLVSADHHGTRWGYFDDTWEETSKESLVTRLGPYSLHDDPRGRGLFQRRCLALQLSELDLPSGLHHVKG